MRISTDSEMMHLTGLWAAHFGWIDNKVDLKVTDLGSFATPTCTLTTHAPVWGTKPEDERAMPIAEVRERLARALRLGRPLRQDMHIALHPNGRAICLFVRMRIRLVGIPITLRTVPFAFVMHAIETDGGRRIDEVHEWAAVTPADVQKVVAEHHGWPADTKLQSHVAFGAVS